MDAMEIMNNEMDEVIEVAETIVPKTNNGLKVAGVAAGALAVGYGLYKGGKWVVNKIKAKKAKDDVEEDVEATEEVDG